MVDTLLLSGLTLAIFIIATLYASVGHGGASGYLATMSLFGLAPLSIRPTALLLNILVAGIAVCAFARAGHFNWRLFWPFAVASVPASFIGGSLTLPAHLYRPLLGIILLYAASRLLWQRARKAPAAGGHPPFAAALLIGAGLGFLSGLSGVGGGIFLSPLLICLGWAGVCETAAASALFIVVNSTAGLLGHVSSVQSIPSFAPVLVIAAMTGGFAGSTLGSRHLPPRTIIRLLSVVLTIASVKLLFL